MEVRGCSWTVAAQRSITNRETEKIYLKCSHSLLFPSIFLYSTDKQFLYLQFPKLSQAWKYQAVVSFSKQPPRVLKSIWVTQLSREASQCSDTISVSSFIKLPKEYIFSTVHPRGTLLLLIVPAAMWTRSNPCLLDAACCPAWHFIRVMCMFSA